MPVVTSPEQTYDVSNWCQMYGKATHAQTQARRQRSSLALHWKTAIHHSPPGDEPVDPRAHPPAKLLLKSPASIYDQHKHINTVVIPFPPSLKEDVASRWYVLAELSQTESTVKLGWPQPHQLNHLS